MEKAHQTPFERRVVIIVEELDKIRDQHQKFNHKKELVEALQLKQRDWTKYARSIRHIPAIKHKHIRQYLIDEFGANPAWLDYGREPMLLKQQYVPAAPVESLVADRTAPPSKVSITKEMWEAKLQEVADLRRMNEVQAMLIASLQQQLEASKKPSKGATNHG